jgi:hypothetical protein
MSPAQVELDLTGREVTVRLYRLACVDRAANRRSARRTGSVAGNTSRICDLWASRTLAVNQDPISKSLDRDAKRVNRVEALSGETENSGEGVPQRTQRSIQNDSPRQNEESGIVWKCMKKLGISGEAGGDRWRQPTGS